MRCMAAILIITYSEAAIPEQGAQWFPEEFGAPCTTETDRKEDTCHLEIFKKSRKLKKGKKTHDN